MTDILVTQEYVSEIAHALLERDDFKLRLFVQAWLREHPRFIDTPEPVVDDSRIGSAAAAIVELLALRASQAAPPWTVKYNGLAEPFFVMRRAERPGFTRDLCLNESPEPLRRRNIFAPPNFLEMV
jgi:hypothetical protein